jgi:hypothetical protein
MVFFNRHDLDTLPPELPLSSKRLHKIGSKQPSLNGLYEPESGFFSQNRLKFFHNLLK